MRAYYEGNYAKHSRIRSYRIYGIPFIRVQNLVDGTVSVEADPLFIDQTTHDLLRRSKIKPSDILLSIAGTIGRAAIVPTNAEEMNCNQAVAIIRPSSRIDRRFLLHWLSGRDAVDQVTKGKVTGTISNLSLGQIRYSRYPYLHSMSSGGSQRFWIRRMRCDASANARSTYSTISPSRSFWKCSVT